jgi:limonene 1,2-monooxygenase
MIPTNRMKFGVFMAPFHRVGENPTLALDRDLELLQWLDVLGFDEAYIGEHHSAGWETIASPEVFIATAAERTRHIRLGTGVISLPYHHPYMVANRMVLLDHLTRPCDPGSWPRSAELRRLYVWHRHGTAAGDDGRVPGHHPAAND